MSTDSGKHNGNGKDPDNTPDETEEDNVIFIPTLAERDKIRREAEKQWRKDYKKRHKSEPAINLPPVTKYFALLIFLIHAGVQVFLDSPQQYWLFSHFGFVPGAYTGNAPFGLYSFLSPLTYMFLHGNWSHIIMNGVMMAAFGTGVERMIGGRKMLIFFTLCSLSAIFIHFLFSPYSNDPVVGASGGLSGLFAAVIIMLQKMGTTGTGRYGIWPLVILWVIISALFGMMGGPGGGTIAWAAHIGGFLAGFPLLKFVMRMR